MYTSVPLVKDVVTCKTTSDILKLTRPCRNLYTVVVSMKCLMFSNHSARKTVRRSLCDISKKSLIFCEASLYAFESGYVSFETRTPYKLTIHHDRQYLGGKSTPSKELAMP